MSVIEKTELELMQMSPDELATFQGQEMAKTEECAFRNQALCKMVWDRKKAAEQHELDLKLISKQVRAIQYAALIGFIGTLGGVYLGSEIANNKTQNELKAMRSEMTLKVSESLHGNIPLTQGTKSPE